MAINWDSEMQDKLDKLQAALSDEFRTQFKTMGADLEERLAARLEDRLTERLDARLGHRLNVQAEQLRDIVKTAAENYGGVLDSIKGDLAELRNGWRRETEDTKKVLANYGGRIDALEKAVSSS
jgi:DNA anti-recombination protein RmuC